MLVADRIVKVWLHPQWIYQFTAQYRRDKELIDYMFEFTAKIRAVKQAEFEAKKRADAERAATPEDDDDADAVERPPQLFVNEMLKMFDRGELDLRALDEQLVTMIVGVSAVLFFCDLQQLLT